MNTNSAGLFRRGLAFVAITGAGAVLVGACSSGGDQSTSGAGAGSSGDALAAVRLGVEPWIGYGPWHVAASQGFFDEQGVDVTVTNFDTDADINAALASGNLDAASVASHTAMKFQEAGVDVSIVLLLDASEDADAILAAGDVTSVADLKGKKVAYEEGTTSDLLLNYALDSEGMTIDDIEKVPMDANSAGTALISGQVPVAVTYEPYISEALSTGSEIHKLYTASEKEGLISDVLVVNNTFLDEHPDSLAALLRSWDAAIGYYESDADDAKSIIAEAVGSNPEDLTTAFDGVKFFDLADNETQLGGEFTTSTLPAIQTAAVKANILDGSGDISSLVDSSLIAQALGQ